MDLPHGQQSGLRQVQEVLEGVSDIHFARLTSHDVVRHRLVGDIVDAYEKYDAGRTAADRARRGRPRGGRAGALTGERGHRQ